MPAPSEPREFLVRQRPSDVAMYVAIVDEDYETDWTCHERLFVACREGLPILLLVKEGLEPPPTHGVRYVRVHYWTDKAEVLRHGNEIVADFREEIWHAEEGRKDERTRATTDEGV